VSRGERSEYLHDAKCHCSSARIELVKCNSVEVKNCSIIVTYGTVLEALVMDFVGSNSGEGPHCR